MPAGSFGALLQVVQRQALLHPRHSWPGVDEAAERAEGENGQHRAGSDRLRPSAIARRSARSIAKPDQSGQRQHNPLLDGEQPIGGERQGPIGAEH